MSQLQNLAAFSTPVLASSASRMPQLQGVCYVKLNEKGAEANSSAPYYANFFLNKIASTPIYAHQIAFSCTNFHPESNFAHQKACSCAKQPAQRAHPPLQTHLRINLVLQIVDCKEVQQLLVHIHLELAGDVLYGVAVVKIKQVD